jgi:hypothetical protein
MSRKEGRPYTNTFVAIQKIRRETMITGAVNALGKGGKVNDSITLFEHSSWDNRIGLVLDIPFMQMHELLKKHNL